MHLELVTPPAAEPLSLAEGKAHLRATGTDEDALITRLLAAARRQVEAVTRRRLITQSWRIYFDAFPGSADLVLPDVAPVSAISSMKYIDTSGVLQTVSSSVYQLVAEAPARIVLAYDQTWPSERGDRDGVRVEVTAGYGAAGNNVPEDILAAQLLILGHLYEHREDVGDFEIHQIPAGAQALLSPYVVPAF